jgi:NTP pyrophosphatase (non-canonical NTP hydrolase)
MTCYIPDEEAVGLVLNERQNQFLKWGNQNHDMMTWLAILHEETGELAQACLHKKFGGSKSDDVLHEAVQVAAVGLQIVEHLKQLGRMK